MEKETSGRLMADTITVLVNRITVGKLKIENLNLKADNDKYVIEKLEKELKVVSDANAQRYKRLLERDAEVEKLKQSERLALDILDNTRRRVDEVSKMLNDALADRNNTENLYEASVKEVVKRNRKIKQLEKDRDAWKDACLQTDRDFEAFKKKHNLK